jgi:hypothetical protein
MHGNSWKWTKFITRILDLHQDFDPSSYCLRMDGNKCIIKLEMEKIIIKRILDLHQDFDPSSYCPRMHGNK